MHQLSIKDIQNRSPDLYITSPPLVIMLSVNCRDVGVNCDYKGTGETEEELMNNLVSHAI